MTEMPNDDRTVKTTGVIVDEGGEAAANSASLNGTDLSSQNNNVPDEDAPGRTIDDQPTHGPEKDSAVPSKEFSTSHNTTKSEKKIRVHLVAVGMAPILKQSKFLMNADDRFAVAIAFLRKVLKLSSSSTTSNITTSGIKASSLFLYVNAAFVPSPDERIGDLFDCFGSRGELVIHYSLQEAWG
jgi:ubiquitin-like protein ATG12